MSSEEYLFTLVDDIQAREASAGYASLAPAEQVFFCVWTVEAEVNNGGFEQLYENTSADVVAHAPTAFRAIDAAHTASLLEEANAVFGPDGPPASQAAREELIADLDDVALDRLEELTGSFLEYHDNLSELLAAYMKANQ